jgi:hypothetical protein
MSNVDVKELKCDEVCTEEKKRCSDGTKNFAATSRSTAKRASTLMVRAAYS